MKVAFLGTPSIGAAALKSLLNHKDIEVVVAVTIPDKAIGRSHSELTPSPVTILAEENNIDIIKTNSINEDISKLKEYDFDYILTCAFGQFLSNEVLSLPKIKSLNIHGSLLPEGRGGAPIHWAIINGKSITGISVMEMVSKMDAGDFYSQFGIEISQKDTADTLFEKMSDLILEKAAVGLVEVHNGKTATKQDESLVSFWMNIKKEDSKIEFELSDDDILNKIRGLDSKPGAWSNINNKIVKIHSAVKDYGSYGETETSTILKIDSNGMVVKTSEGSINIKNVTLEGGKRTDTSNLFKSKKIKVGDIFY